jgi:hypothetical protein
MLRPAAAARAAMARAARPRSCGEMHPNHHAHGMRRARGVRRARGGLYARAGVGRARVPCAERVPCAVRATVAPAARCRSICCVWPYWVPLVDAVLNVVVWAAARRRGRVVWDHAARSSTLQTPGRPG